MTGGFAQKEEDPSIPSILKLFDDVTEWRPAAKKGKKVYDDHEFVRSLADQYSRRHSLSSRQIAALKRVATIYKSQIPDCENRIAALAKTAENEAQAQ